MSNIKFKAFNKEKNLNGDIVDITWDNTGVLEPTVVIDYENGERDSINSKHLIITMIHGEKGGLQIV